MLKIIGRILLILLVAGAIGGGIYAFVNSSLGQSALTSAGLTRGEGFDRGARPSDLQNLAAPAGQSGTGFQAAPRFDGGGDFRDGVSLERGLAGVAQNLAKIALIILAVVLGQKIYRRFFRQRRIAVS